jgi:hypothetical protein
MCSGFGPLQCRRQPLQNRDLAPGLHQHIYTEMRSGLRDLYATPISNVANRGDALAKNTLCIVFFTRILHA